jgi:hypothetical protein
MARGFACHPATATPHRFKAPDMSLGKGLAGCRIVPQMQIHIIPAVIGCRDLAITLSDGRSAALSGSMRTTDPGES